MDIFYRIIGEEDMQSAGSTFVTAHQLSVVNDVSLHGLFYFVSRYASPQPQRLNIQCEKLEVVPVLPVIGRRAGTTVADLMKIVASVDADTANFAGQTFRVGRYVEEDPMRKGSTGGIAIVDDQDKATGILR
jgi:hypothetical protein